MEEVGGGEGGVRRFVHSEELLCGEEVAVHYLSTCCNGSSLLHAHSIGARTRRSKYCRNILKTTRDFI